MIILQVSGKNNDMQYIPLARLIKNNTNSTEFSELEEKRENYVFHHAAYDCLENMACTKNRMQWLPHYQTKV